MKIPSNPPKIGWFQAHQVAFEKAKGKAAEMALNTAEGVPPGRAGVSLFFPEVHIVDRVVRFILVDYEHEY